MERGGIFQNRDMRLAFVNMVMKSKFQKMWRISTSAENMLVSQNDRAVWSWLVRSVTGPNEQF
jgi:hypothetical protein